jgi:hypothetical protein
MKKFLKLIENNKWIFAETMPKIPHYYIVKDDLSNGDKKLFDEFDKYIKINGYSGKFYSKIYIYLNINDYKYWAIDNILNREKI